jgi:hypothetical protein
MPAVRTAMQALKATLAKHPISKAEVNSAVEGVHRVGDPLKQAVQDAKIDVINLLSADQRKTFDNVMTRCMKGRR